jgi:hypothetical protein
LSEQLHSYDDIRDVLDITREDIRRSTNDDEELVKQFSCWCAILDYFETQLDIFAQQQQTSSPPSSRHEPQWVVWTGALTIPNGTFQSYMTTPFWSLGAMNYWKALEMENASFCRPLPNFRFIQPDSSDDDSPRRVPYGTIFALDPTSQRRLSFQCADLAIDHFDEVRNHWRHALIPLSQFYEEDPGIVLVDHSFVSRTYTSHPIGPLLVATARSSLCVCWDKEQGEDDWEFALGRLGERCVEIMKSFPSGRTFQDGLLESDFVKANEFCNFLDQEL